MLKSSRSWQDELHDQICWRFSKYKFVVNDTVLKLGRDLEYLEQFETDSDNDWRLPFDAEGLEKVTGRMKRIIKDLKSLETPLQQVTDMVSPSHMSLRSRVITTCPSKKQQSLTLQTSEWNISP